MKKILQFSLVLIALFMCFDSDLYGQSRGKKKSKKSKTDDYFDESGGFKHRLWYGGGFNLGFAGSNGVSQFNLGVSPMVGYKIIEKFSVGPRVSLDYSFIKVNLGNEVRSVQPLSYSIGAFSRFKVLNNVFAHAEYEFQNEGRITDNQGFINFDNNGDIVINREIRDNFYIGAGYNSGGLVAYEVYVLYNALEPENSPNLPFSIRFGLTYKF